MSRGKLKPVYSHPLHSGKKWKGPLFPNFFLREWGGYTVARKLPHFSFSLLLLNKFQSILQMMPLPILLIH